jgi:anti-sigma regulatory factor (Ser/Thr protein kinase)
MNEFRGRFRLRLPAESTELPTVRRRLRAWLHKLGATQDEVFEITVACNEACANAVEHPREPTEPYFEVEAGLVRDEIRLLVRDFGSWRSGRPEYDRGRGLQIMRAFVDEVDVMPSPSGTEVVLRRRLDRRSRVQGPAIGSVDGLEPQTAGTDGVLAHSGLHGPRAGGPADQAWPARQRPYA